MLEHLTRHWWALALRGVFAIIFGILAWIWPGITLLALVVLFGAYALVDGFAALGTAITGRGDASRVWLAIEGVAGVVIGLLALFWPGITGLVLLLLIAWWAVITGLFEIMAAIRLRNDIQGEWFYIISGVVSVLFGLLLFVWPASGALALIWLIGLFSILFGITMLAASLRIRKISQAGPMTPMASGPL